MVIVPLIDDKFNLVDLSGHLSNPPGTQLRMLGMEKSRVSLLDLPRTARTSVQRQVHISRQKQLELVERYQAGALQRELADIYGIHRRTVAAIVKRHGARRRLGLAAAQVDEAVRRYRAGESLAVIGKAPGVDHGTVRNRLLERGVPMRDTHGRQR